ncbi:uncharacterized protein JCM15063_003836 [Sporobolomyces koalae]|uniref:uncharacterized protein n=1 Tax=Sporobolomyces koalae TaxID=500713 RepID=UPI00316D59EB
MESLDTKQHVLFALRHAKYLPTPYEPEDANRMTLGYFCLSALALLPSPVSAEGSDPSGSALDSMLRPVQTQGFIDWVYEQQVPSGGFRGSNSIECPVPPQPLPSSSSETLDPPNLIQSYTAILILALLNDSLARLDRVGLLRFLGRCQNPNGS